jgi:hypothetical protein
MGLIQHAEDHVSLGIHGRLALTSVNAEWFAAHRNEVPLMLRPPDEVVTDRREGDNVMCTAGLTVLASAIAWSGIQDQATNLGVSSSYLTPLWGAVGNGSPVTPAASDTALVAELERQTVGASASSPATASIPSQFTWLFYFPQPATAWTVTEAGVFCNGSSNDATIASAGVMLDHWALSPSVSVPTTDTLILQCSFSITGV